MSFPRPSGGRSRGRSVWLLLLVMLVLCGCEYIDSALPPTPSPFPVLQRLPTVTPITPSPTFPPTPTRRPTSTPTPTRAVPYEGTVAVGANIRTGPGIDFAIIRSVVAGNDVQLMGQLDGWYKVVVEDGTEGWMSGQVLEVSPEAATAVPVTNVE